MFDMSFSYDILKMNDSHRDKIWKRLIKKRIYNVYVVIHRIIIKEEIINHGADRKVLYE